MKMSVGRGPSADATTPTDSPMSAAPPTSPCATPLRKTIPALNMRMKTFKKSSARIHESLNRCRSGKPLHRFSGCQRGSNLELLRKALQPSINREMKKMFDEYHELFSMANENIRENIARDDDSKPEQFMLIAMKIALDEAKRTYCSQIQSHNSALASQKPSNKKRPVVAALDASRLLAVIDGAEFGANPLDNSSQSWLQPGTDTKRVPMQWSLSRIHGDTLFTLGSRANKALGLGTTRGRLYIKHPEIFKYPADQADKQWLSENGHMAGVGGRVYLVFTDDLLELAESREYKNMPGVNASLITGFKLPNHILNKARQYMSTMVQYIKKAASNAAAVPAVTAPSVPSVANQQQVNGGTGAPLRDINASSAPRACVKNAQTNV